MKLMPHLMPIHEHLLRIVVPVAVPHVSGGHARLGGGRVEAGGVGPRHRHLGVALTAGALHAHELAASRRLTSQEPE